MYNCRSSLRDARECSCQLERWRTIWPGARGEPSMRGSGRFRFFAMALTLATSMFVLFTPAARAQDDPFASDAVVAQGNPPLTESMVTRFTNFQAWLFEIPFTQQQRERIRAMLLQDW